MAITQERLEDSAGASFVPDGDVDTQTRSSPDRLETPVPDRSGEPAPALGPDPHAGARRSWSRALLALWIVVMLSTLFEPAPNPNAIVPLWASVLGFAFLTGVFTTVWGLAGNQRWALKASLATSGLGLGMAAACAVTDHHPAFWWGYEMVAMGALFAFNRLALTKTSS